MLEIRSNIRWFCAKAHDVNLQTTVKQFFSVAPPFVPAVSRGQTKRESKQRVAKELKSEGGLDLGRVG